VQVIMMCGLLVGRARSRLLGHVRLFRRWRGDEKGTTAIEFAMVSAPFMLLAFGIMGIGLQFFTINALEQGVSSAARRIRTGTAQTGTIIAGQTDDTTLANFKQLVCEESGSYISCDSKLVVHVQSGAEWADIVPVNCVTSGNLTPQTGADSDKLVDYSGGANQVVLVTACYEWDLGGEMWQKFWNLLAAGAWSHGEEANEAGKVIVQAVATFRTEPYE
jgi:Flp pilus assembly protein TadG